MDLQRRLCHLHNNIIAARAIFRLPFAVLLVLIATAQVWSQSCLPFEEPHPAIVPVAQDWPDWRRWHHRYKEISKRDAPRVVFLGDSITQGWAREGKSSWNRHFSELPAANFGIAGDRTQHVLWRVADGCFQHSRPEVVVLLIGTNNIKEKRNTPRETVEGIKAVCDLLADRLPESQIMLLGLLPCGESAQSQQRVDAAIVNAELQATTFSQRVTYLDVSQDFVEPDGTISKQIMPDYLHLSAAGYEQFANAILPTLRQLSLTQEGRSATQTP